MLQGTTWIATQHQAVTEEGSAAGIDDVCSGLPAGWAWKDVAGPKPYPKEFRDDVVRVAQNRESG